MTEEMKEVRDNFIKTVHEFNLKGNRLKKAYKRNFPNHSVHTDRDHIIFKSEPLNLAVYHDGKVVVL